MTHEARVQQYDFSARREEDAAVAATTSESARLHGALADMYRNEAAKMRSVHHALKLAFGEEAGVR